MFKWLGRWFVRLGKRKTPSGVEEFLEQRQKLRVTNVNNVGTTPRVNIGGSALGAIAEFQMGGSGEQIVKLYNPPHVGLQSLQRSGVAPNSPNQRGLTIPDSEARRRKRVDVPKPVPPSSNSDSMSFPSFYTDMSCNSPSSSDTGCSSSDSSSSCSSPD